MPARVLVIGPGAIGGAVLGALVANDHEGVVAARTPFARIDVTHPEGHVVGEVRCLAEPDAGLEVDAVVLAVKVHQTASAAHWIEAATRGSAPLFVLQNGVEQIANAKPWVTSESAIVPTVVNLPASRKAPGRVVVGGKASLTVPAIEGASVLAELLADSFVRVHVVDDWQTAAWVKLLMNAGLGGVGVLTQRDNRVFDDPEARALGVALMEEVAAVGRAEGARIDDRLPSQLIDRVRAAAGDHASSIVVDRRAGVPTEWDARNAVVGRIAERHGIDVPLNNLVTTLIRLGEPD